MMRVGKSMSRGVRAVASPNLMPVVYRSRISRLYSPVSCAIVSISLAVRNRRGVLVWSRGIFMPRAGFVSSMPSVTWYWSTEDKTPWALRMVFAETGCPLRVCDGWFRCHATYSSMSWRVIAVMGVFGGMVFSQVLWATRRYSAVVPRAA